MVITAAMQHRVIVVPEGHSDLVFWLFGGFLYQIDSLELCGREAFGDLCIFLLGMAKSKRSRKIKDTPPGAMIITMSASALVCH